MTLPKYHIEKKIYFILIAALFFSGAFLLLVDPIAQNSSYHQFADHRKLFGIPNMWNVFSNIPFVLIGCFGLLRISTMPNNVYSRKFTPLFTIFFLGLILTGMGSAYYHFAPTNQTLIWDRIPMTITFMAFFTFIFSCHSRIKSPSTLLFILVILGIGSVCYWAYTEQFGRGDLRFYALVQFLPILLIPMLLILLPHPPYSVAAVLMIIGIYILAKLAEHWDMLLFQILGFSGHSMKHVIAAMSGQVFLLLLQRLNFKDLD